MPFDLLPVITVADELIRRGSILSFDTPPNFDHNNTDITTLPSSSLSALLRQLWSRIPDGVVSFSTFQSYTDHRTALQAAGPLPYNAFHLIFPLIANSHNHLHSIYTFFHLFLHNPGHLGPAALWAFNHPAYTGLAPGINSFNSAISAIHLLFSDYTRSLSSSLPPPISLHPTPKVTLFVSRLSASPEVLLARVAKVLSFDDPTLFPSHHAHTALAALCALPPTLPPPPSLFARTASPDPRATTTWSAAYNHALLDPVSRRIAPPLANYVFSEAQRPLLKHAVLWQNGNPVRPPKSSGPVTRARVACALALVNVADGADAAWRASISLEQDEQKKAMFGRAILVRNGNGDLVVIEEVVEGGQVDDTNYQQSDTNYQTSETYHTKNRTTSETCHTNYPKTSETYHATSNKYHTNYTPTKPPSPRIDDDDDDRVTPIVSHAIGWRPPSPGAGVGLKSGFDSSGGFGNEYGSENGFGSGFADGNNFDSRAGFDSRPNYLNTPKHARNPTRHRTSMPGRLPSTEVNSRDQSDSWDRLNGVNSNLNRFDSLDLDKRSVDRFNGINLRGEGDTGFGRDFGSTRNRDSNPYRNSHPNRHPDPGPNKGSNRQPTLPSLSTLAFDLGPMRGGAGSAHVAALFARPRRGKQVGRYIPHDNEQDRYNPQEYGKNRYNSQEHGQNRYTLQEHGQNRQSPQENGQNRHNLPGNGQNRYNPQEHEQKQYTPQEHGPAAHFGPRETGPCFQKADLDLYPANPQPDENPYPVNPPPNSTPRAANPQSNEDSYSTLPTTLCPPRKPVHSKSKSIDTASLSKQSVLGLVSEQARNTLKPGQDFRNPLKPSQSVGNPQKLVVESVGTPLKSGQDTVSSNPPNKIADTPLNGPLAAPPKPGTLIKAKPNSPRRASIADFSRSGTTLDIGSPYDVLLTGGKRPGMNASRVSWQGNHSRVSWQETGGWQANPSKTSWQAFPNSALPKSASTNSIPPKFNSPNFNSPNSTSPNSSPLQTSWSAADSQTDLQTDSQSGRDSRLSGEFQNGQNDQTSHEECQNIQISHDEFQHYPKPHDDSRVSKFSIQGLLSLAKNKA